MKWEHVAQVKDSNKFHNKGKKIQSNFYSNNHY